MDSNKQRSGKKEKESRRQVRETTHRFYSPSNVIYVHKIG